MPHRMSPKLEPVTITSGWQYRKRVPRHGGARRLDADRVRRGANLATALRAHNRAGARSFDQQIMRNLRRKLADVAKPDPERYVDAARPRMLASHVDRALGHRERRFLHGFGKRGM